MSAFGYDGYLGDLRALEMESFVEWLRREVTVDSWERALELGCGSGVQGGALRGLARRLHAIDMSDWRGREHRERYDSFALADMQRLPFPDATFDFVFSSNAVEHVADFNSAIAEAARVLRPGGLAAHIVPNALWKWLSLLGYFPLLPVACVFKVARRIRAGGSLRPSTLFLPGKHGAFDGSTLSELRTFSSLSWNERFAAALTPLGTGVRHVPEARLPFYSSYGFLRFLPARWRRASRRLAVTSLFVHGARGCPLPFARRPD